MGSLTLSAYTPARTLADRADASKMWNVLTGRPRNESEPVADMEARTGSRARVDALSASATYRLSGAQRAAAARQAEEAPAAFQQLEFEFTGELRLAALQRFSRETAQAAEGLEGPARSRFIEASRAVAARFSVSVRISAAALEGFAGAAKGAAGNGTLTDRLAALVEKLQGFADEMFERTITLLGDFFRAGKESEDLFAAVNRFFDGLFADLAGSGASARGGFRFAQVQLEFSFEFTAVAVETEAEVQQADPLVLDLNGNGVQLTSYRDGARFDLLGNGRAVNTAFVTGGDAFLAIDRNGNGVIDSGKELFGDQNGARNGFEELRKLDVDGNGVIDRRDPDFHRLLLWRDNGNGITEPGELISLAEAGIESISLNYREVRQAASGGNTLAQVASFTWSDGRTGFAADALLNYTA